MQILIFDLKQAQVQFQLDSDLVIGSDGEEAKIEANLSQSRVQGWGLEIEAVLLENESYLSLQPNWLGLVLIYKSK